MMSEILDEHLAQKTRQEELCKKLRFYTLLFTGLMAIIFLLFNLLHWRYGRVFLVIGLITITIQSILCFLTMQKKTWLAGVRALITLIATLYILSIIWA